MDVDITIVETQETHYTYTVSGVSSLTEAKKIAAQYHKDHFYADRCYLSHKIPYPPQESFGSMQLINQD